MRVVVTGGSGYIGSHTARLLATEGHDVVNLDRASPPAVLANVPHHAVDLLDFKAVEAAIREHAAEAVVHLAAEKSVPESFVRPDHYLWNNAAGTLSLLAALRESDVRAFVFSSTCAVYGTPRQLPVSEREPVKPENPYGHSKLLAERAVSAYAGTRSMPFLVLRYFNAAGAWPDGSLGEDLRDAQNLVPVAMRAALQGGEPISIFGTDYPTPDGTAIRDYIHVMDLARAHLRALEYLLDGGPSATVNLGTGSGHSVSHVIATVADRTGIALPTVPCPRRIGDPPAIWADPSLAQGLLDWRVREDLADIVDSAWRWHTSSAGPSTSPEHDSQDDRRAEES